MRKFAEEEAAPDAAGFELGENHRRAIGTTLALLDEMLCDFERWAGGDEAQGVLFREHNALSRTQRREILQRIKALRLILESQRDELKLKPRVRDVADGMWGACAALTDTVIELGSRYLRRYGPLPEGFGAWFDPQVDSLQQAVRDISDALKKRE